MNVTFSTVTRTVRSYSIELTPEETSKLRNFATTDESIAFLKAKADEQRAQGVTANQSITINIDGQPFVI